MLCRVLLLRFNCSQSNDRSLWNGALVNVQLLGSLVSTTSSGAYRRTNTWSEPDLLAAILATKRYVAPLLKVIDFCASMCCNRAARWFVFLTPMKRRWREFSNFCCAMSSL